jgi:hypothetical protein
VSIRSGIRTAVVAVLLGCSAIVAVRAIPAANAATPACGSTCTAVAVQEFGRGYVTAVSGTAKVGAEIVLAKAVATSAEDFQLVSPGTVAEFYADGIVGPAVGETWPTDAAYEYVYDPDGHESSLCIGVASTAAAGTDLTLQPCGVDANTVWIPLPNDNIGGWEPVINATDTAVNYPYVMTAVKVGAPVITQQMYLYKGAFSPVQTWADVNGVY